MDMKVLLGRAAYSLGSKFEEESGVVLITCGTDVGNDCYILHLFIDYEIWSTEESALVFKLL